MSFFPRAQFAVSVSAAVLAGLLSLLPGPANAQTQGGRGQLYNDGCYYVTVVNLVIPRGQPGYATMIRQGCLLARADGVVFYIDDRTHTWRDEATGYLYGYDRNGTWIVLTDRGWAPFVGRQAAPQPSPAPSVQQTPRDFGFMLPSPTPRKRDCVDDPYTPECQQERRDRNGYDCRGKDIDTGVCKNKEFNRRMDDKRDERGAEERRRESQRQAQADADRAEERRREEARRQRR